MRASPLKWRSLSLVLFFGTVVASGGLVISTAGAQSVIRTAVNTPNAAPADQAHSSTKAKATSASKHHVAKGSRGAAGKSSPVRYYVDFRARSAASYGHAFVWYGRVGDPMVEVAGLHPATDSVIPYIIGHILPVPSETGASYGDLDEEYLQASYRVTMDAEQAQKVFAFIKHIQATSPLWQAATINCTNFIGRIAQFMGLEVPVTSLLYPEIYVNRLHELNGNNPKIRINSSIYAGG